MNISRSYTAKTRQGGFDLALFDSTLFLQYLLLELILIKASTLSSRTRARFQRPFDLAHLSEPALNLGRYYITKSWPLFHTEW